MPGTSKTSTTIGIRMPNELRAEVMRIAERERRSIAWVVVDAVAEYVKRDELKGRKAPRD
jgi:predicted transcriptional regulator